MTQQSDTWMRRNWVALWAASCFLMAVLQSWKWFTSHNQDAAIEAVFNFLVGIAFALMHRGRRRDEKYQGELKRAREGSSFRADERLKVS
jgi:predicted negative regulator of RcsB-dependent stress response